MTRPTTRIRARRGLYAVAVAALLGVSGCAQGEIDVNEANREGAVLFNERCSGCHTFKRANSYGSKPEGQLAGGERTNGPNFNVRKVNRDDALYAIRNGGFSGAIMPANIVVGEDAEKVADFLEKYSGEERGEGTDVQGSGEQTP
ncbi:MAG TPA: cytochrome c [Thermoleophilaceae bacterium]|nr:cytochrome c [Thermoleophilaceae bacterium]